MKPKRFLLTVFAPHFCASSVWTRQDDGTYRCTRAAPIIKWIANMNASEAKIALRQRGLPFKATPLDTTDEQ